MTKTGFWSKYGGGHVVQGEVTEKEWRCQSCASIVMTEEALPNLVPSHVKNEELKVCDECKRNGMVVLYERIRVIEKVYK